MDSPSCRLAAHGDWCILGFLYVFVIECDKFGPRVLLSSVGSARGVSRSG